MNEEKVVSGSMVGYVQSYILCNRFKDTLLWRPWKRVYNWATHQLLIDWGW